ncbi:hypothetical protein [Bacillus spizizenii]
MSSMSAFALQKLMRHKNTNVTMRNVITHYTLKRGISIRRYLFLFFLIINSLAACRLFFYH